MLKLAWESYQPATASPRLFDSKSMTAPGAGGFCGGFGTDGFPGAGRNRKVERELQTPSVPSARSAMYTSS